MNLIVDIGNSRIKTASFEGHELIDQQACKTIPELIAHAAGKNFEHVIVSSVRANTNDVVNSLSASGKKIQLSSSSPLPIDINYDTPQTLGVDRLAAACGAWHLFPGKNCVVIDMGTCITYDLVLASGSFEGGAIAPGIRMRFAAMNHFTARLPKGEPVVNPPLTGKSTMASIQSGVINGVLGEINEFISRYESRYAPVTAVACGGDLAFFENSLKPSIFVAPNLVLIGLNRILLHHVNN